MAGDRPVVGVLFGLGRWEMIVETPGVCFGKPRIEGTRISVYDIKQMRDAGRPVSQICEAYPHVGFWAIEEAIRYIEENEHKVRYCGGGK